MLNRSLIEKLTRTNSDINSGVNKDPLFLKVLQTLNLRNFPISSEITFNSPITAIVGRNGTGKSTLLYLSGCAFAPPLTAGQKRTLGKTFNEFIPDSQRDKMPVGSSYGFIYGDDARQYYVWHERTSGDEARRGNKEWDRRPRSALRKQKPTIFLGFEKNIPNPLVLSDFFGLTREKIAERLDAIGRSNSDLVALKAEVVSKISHIAGKRYSKIERRLDKYSRLGFDALGYVVNGQYSDIAAGSGEIGIIRMVDAIMNAPGHSLIVIDEPESGVHQIAQQRLLEFFVQEALNKNHQIVFTTHSEYMLEGLAPASILLLERSESGGSVFPQHVNKSIALREIGQSVKAKFSAVVEDDFAAILLEQILESDPSIRQLVDIQVAVVDGWQHMVNTEFPKRYCAYQCINHSPCPLLVLDGDVEAEMKLVDLDDTFGSLAKIKKFNTTYGIDRLIKEITRLSGKPGTIRFKSLFKPHLPPNDTDALLKMIADYVHHFQTHLVFFPGGEPPDVVICEWLQLQLNISSSGIQQMIRTLLASDKKRAFERQFGEPLPSKEDYQARVQVSKDRIEALQQFKPSMRDQVLAAWVNEQSDKILPMVKRLTEVIDA